MDHPNQLPFHEVIAPCLRAGDKKLPPALNAHESTWLARCCVRRRLPVLQKSEITVAEKAIAPSPKQTRANPIIQTSRHLYMDVRTTHQAASIK
jgi:hypothetical protein